jgi:amino acid transporter
VKPQPIRTTIIFALVASLIWVGISYFLGPGSVTDVLIGFPIFFAVIFFTMRITNRMTVFALSRWGPKPPERAPKGPAVTEATSERVDHAKRRRDARRHRARRRRQR